jgi:hypothetical protein
MISDLSKAKASVVKWLSEFVELPHPALHNFPVCPYAKRARLDNKIDFRIGINPYNDLVSLAHSGLTGFDVVIFIYDPAEYAGEAFTSIISLANKIVLKEKGLISLSDHPMVKEEALGINFNQGEYALSVCAEVSGLNSGAKSLHAQGYYDGWPEEYLTLLFEHRQDPR